MREKLLLITTIFILSAFNSTAAIKDSIGLKEVDGKKYIMHEVEKGEGLFGISKKYGVKLTDLMAANPGSEDVIKVGQVLLIPMIHKSSHSLPNQTGTSASNNQKIHVVEKGETLYGVARKYDVKVHELVEANKLENTQIEVGQSLVIPPSEDVVSENKTKMPVSEKKVLEEVKNEKEEIPAVDPLPEDYGVEKKLSDNFNNTSKYTIEVVKTPDYNVEKVYETGVALTIENSDLPQSGELVLHHELPKNTYLLITNPENNKSIFVKVEGNFVFSSTESVVVKIPQRVANKLDIKGKKNPIKVSYAR